MNMFYQILSWVTMLRWEQPQVKSTSSHHFRIQSAEVNSSLHRTVSTSINQLTTQIPSIYHSFNHKPSPFLVNPENQHPTDPSHQWWPSSLIVRCWSLLPSFSSSSLGPEASTAVHQALDTPPVKQKVVKYDAHFFWTPLRERLCEFCFKS